MIVLAFDTATPATVVALSLGGEALEARDDPADGERPGHATRLLPLAVQLLTRAGVGWGEIDRIAVGVGPGTFTGLRVGIATAHGLAQSRQLPLVGVSSLRALALGVPEDRPVLAAIDARRGEMFLAGYQGAVQLLAPVPVAPTAVGGLLSGATSRWLAVGDGAVRYRSALEQAGVDVAEDGSPLHRVRGPALCELGAAAPAVAAPVLPAYLRRPDATPAPPVVGAARGAAG